MIKLFNDGGRLWAVRLVFYGDRYGLDNKLVHDKILDGKKDVLVEFYDTRFLHDNIGQFVSRYYAETLLTGELRQPGRGLCLDGGHPTEWSISAKTLPQILVWVRAQREASRSNPPIDRQWLSQYVGDMQKAWSEGDLHKVDELLHDSEFNDRIYYTP
jgi:hypothetical protein